MSESQPNQPNLPNKKAEDAVQTMMLIRLSAELQVHRELLCNLLAKESSTLSGKTPSDYIEEKVQERVNLILAGVADISHPTATLFSNFLLPKQKPDKPPG